MSNVNVNQNFQIFNDDILNDVKVNNIETILSLIVPIKPNLNQPASYPQTGEIAYDVSHNTIMFCDGVAWLDLVGGGAGINIAVGGGLTGNGTVATPLALNIQHDSSLTGVGTTASLLELNIQHDTSLTGIGTSGSPLALVAQGAITPGLYTDTTLVVNQQGIITSIASQNQLTVFFASLETQAPLTMLANTQYTLSGYFAFANNGGAWNLGTGIFTVPVNGIYHFDAWGQINNLPGAIASLYICDPSGTPIYAAGNAFNQGLTVSLPSPIVGNGTLNSIAGVSNINVSTTVSLPAGVQLSIQIIQGGGGPSYVATTTTLALGLNVHSYLVSRL